MTALLESLDAEKSIGSSGKNNESPGLSKARQRVDKSLVGKAVNALIKFHRQEASKSKVVPLLGTDAPVQVQFTLEIAPQQAQIKPISVLIPHRIHKLTDQDDEALEEPSVCLIVKEDSKPWVQEIISQFPDEMGCVKKVLGLQSLRTKHATFQQRRDLMHKYSVFLADDRILPMLTKALGTTFIRAKRQPVPVKLNQSSKHSLPVAIRKALSATHMFLSNGTCVSVRAGMTDMSPKKLVDNILAVCGSYNKGDLKDSLGAVRKIPRQWANIRAIAIKTPTSVALPIYNKTPEELIEISKLAGLDSVWKEQKKVEKSDKEEEKREKERKRKLSAAKSPLVKALKKQKQQEQGKKGGNKVQLTKQDEEKDKDESSKGKKEGKSDAKEVVKSSAAKTKAKVQAKVSEKKRSLEESAGTSSKKKKESMPPVSDQEQGDFIASKKYKGSKKGFVFQKGNQGVGYYRDSKPVVDKMALEALFRMAKQGGSRGGRSQKSGSGGRRKRR